MDYFELETCIIEWAKERRIFLESNPMKQSYKTLEEVTELINAIYDRDKTGIKDALGDIMVTLIIQAEMQGVDLEDCMTDVFKIISKRKGKMINGLFVKD
jgi:NTP pyrophosphatase (non-canonical NTP hydrolase)